MKMIKLFALNKVSAGLLALGLCVLAGQAAIVVQDDFNYPTGSLAGADGGLGWKGAWSLSEKASGAIVNGVAGGAAKYMALSAGSDRTAEARRDLAAPLRLDAAEGMTIYFSVRMARADTGTLPTKQVSFLFLRDRYGRPLLSFGANSHNGLLLVAYADGKPIASAKNTPRNAYKAGASLETAPQYRVLGKLVLKQGGTDSEFSLSLLPADQPLPAQEPAQWGTTLRADVAGLAEKIYFTAGAGAGSLYLGDFTMGTRYGDMLDANSSAALSAATGITSAPAGNPAAPGEELAASVAPSTGTIRNIWLEKHDGYNRDARKGDVDLLFLGDSITEGWRYRGEAPQVWKAYYGNRKAANFGIGGDRVEHLLWRVENSDWSKISPKLVVILIGTNNIAHHRPSDIARGILKVVDAVRAKLPQSKILLMSVFPREESADHVFRKRTEEVNRILAQANLPANVTLMDISEKFLDSNGVLSKSLFYDGVHPSRKAHEIWAEAIEPMVKSTVDGQ